MWSFWSNLSSLVAPVHCAESGVPPPPPADPSASDDKPKEDPIIFDESESPLLRAMEQRHPMRPPSFEALSMPLRMLTHIEPNDGVKVDVGIGISQRL